MMDAVRSALVSPWPWYVAGPLLGLTMPLLLWLGNRPFGLSANLRHLCAMPAPGGSYFRYDWRRHGAWNLTFLAGALIGGAIVGWLAPSPELALSPATVDALAGMGVRDVTGYAPASLFSWHALTTWRGAAVILGGGFLVGFGSAYAGGCTSGHAITGLADAQLPSLIAVCGFFAGGLIATHLLLPWLLT